MTTQAELEAAYELARKAGDKRAAVTASAALSAWIMQHNPPKRRGLGCRAGRQQQAARHDA